MSNHRPGVLIISPYLEPNVGGQETHIHDLSKGVANAGHPVYRLAYRPLTTKVDTYRRHERAANIETFRLPWPHGDWVFWVMNQTVWLYFFYLTPGLFLLSLFFLLFRGREVQVIHAHGLVAALIARILGPLFGKTTVMSIHSVYNFAERPELASKVGVILRGLDRVFPLAPASERDLLATGLSPEKLHQTTQWLDLDRFSPDHNGAQELADRAPNATIRILSVGRMYEGKGLMPLAEAVERTPGVHLFVVGTGPLEEPLSVIGKRTGRVHLLGRKAQHELPALFAAADLVSVPSLVEEGFSRVVMEALACGKPVLASNRGCLPQMIEHNRTGWLIEPTADALAAQIEEIAVRSGDLVSMSEQARSHAEEHFSEANVSQVLEGYFGPVANG